MTVLVTGTLTGLLYLKLTGSISPLGPSWPNPLYCSNNDFCSMYGNMNAIRPHPIAKPPGFVADAHGFTPY